MASKVELINSLSAPSQCAKVSDMTVSRRIILKLKKQPDMESAKVKSVMENLGGDRKKASKFTVREGCSINKNNVSIFRKRKMSESSKYDSSEDVSVLTGVSTRCLSSQTGEGEKMDPTKLRQCASILKTLMCHPSGWMFSQPVDPVALRIPDYFTIISKPMDLGTIKDKLERKRYSNVHQFAEDVRLTFSNAMTYNPPANMVHIAAKGLNKTFESRWKLMKWSNESANALPQPRSTEKDTVSSKESMSSMRDSEGLLRKSQKTNGGIRVTSVNISSTVPNIPSAYMKNISPCVSADFPSGHHEFKQASSSSVDSESLFGRKSCTSQSSVSKSDDEKTSRVKELSHMPDKIGGRDAASADGDSLQHRFHHSPLSAGTDLPCEQLPPCKALRAAILKTRFVDTILKAHQKTLPDNGEKSDPSKLKREREELEKKQMEEKMKIEAELRAADAAKMKARADRLMQREKQREAARLALEKMERTIDVDDNFLTFRELENFVSSKVIMRCNLAELGLIIKEDNMDEEDEDSNSTFDMNLEEGEIPS